jgi:hypothetical protein
MALILKTTLLIFLFDLQMATPNSDIDSLLPWNWKDDLSRLKVSATDEYIEQDYPIDQLIIKLDFKGKVYFDDICQAPPQITGVSELAALSP